MIASALRFGLGSLFLVLVAGCSSKGAAAPADGDGGVGEDRPVGATCDPSLATPCTTTEEACAAVVCDGKTLRCTVVASDAGGCGSTPPTSCLGDGDCAGGACVNGLCYRTCLTSSDCDGGACTTVCPSDASAGGCHAYCTSGAGK